MENLDWTHKNVKIIDIRKLKELYVIWVEKEGMLFISSKIFEDRIRQYFLKDIDRVSRNEILELHWNMYLTKGSYVKIDKNGQKTEFPQADKEKMFCSYLEIAGLLGNFSSVYRDTTQEKIYLKHE